MIGDKHKFVITSQALADALASGRMTWWGQYTTDGPQVQRGDTIVFDLTAVYGGGRPSLLNMTVTDAQDVTMPLPIGGSEQTANVLVVRVLSLRPADAVGELR